MIINNNVYLQQLVIEKIIETKTENDSFNCFDNLGKNKISFFPIVVIDQMFFEI